MPYPQPFEGQTSYGRSHELQNLAVDCFDHPPHLSIAPFGNDNFQMRVFPGVAHPLHFSGFGRAIGKRNPAA